MKRALLICSLLLLISVTALAHKAAAQDIQYDKSKNLLTVSFEHKVSNPANHFITKIEIKLNNKDLLEQDSYKQESALGGSFFYKVIDAKPGDKFTLTTTCNKGGKLASTYEVK